MTNWQNFQDNIVTAVEKMDDNQVQFKGYAMTYALNIMTNIEEGRHYGYSDEDATRTQMLYVISNLSGASREELDTIAQLSIGVGIDLADIIQEMEEEESGY